MRTQMLGRQANSLKGALALVTAVMGYLDYWDYSKSSHADPDAWMDLVRGQGSAPSQYRVGVIRLAYFITRHSHLAMRHALELIDVAAAVLCVFILFSLLGSTRAYRQSSASAQLVAGLCFLALVQFYFAWITWFQRPETLTSALLVSLVLLLLTQRFPFPNPLAAAATMIFTLILAALQGFVRADVAFGLHAGILLFCLTPLSRGLSLSRSLQAVTSLLAVVVAGGIQFYLMHIAYPHASYGDTPVVQFWMNLKPGSRHIPFLLFILPVVLLTAWTVRNMARVYAPARALLAGAVVYFFMWIAVGKVDEVRIFVPFALSLAPATALAMSQWLLRDNEGGAEPPSLESI